MPNVKIVNLIKRFVSARGEDFLALDRLNLDIPDRKYSTLLGPSGCGKTTLLRIIAGLLEPTSGQILFDNMDVSGKMTQERDIGFVFQNFSIFPHMDVWHNTAYGPVVRGWSQEEIAKTVERNLKLVGLEKRDKALPHELSGGMNQRLGLARALAGHSSLLLLDEPLSALDAKIGAFLRYELKKIAKTNHLTAIHVTHNQEEAMTISDNIILMRKGEIVQTGTPEALYDQPNSMFAANFIGKCNFFNARKKSPHSVEIDGKMLQLPDEVLQDKIVIGIRPEKIHLDPHPDQIRFSGRIELINFLGHLYEYRINVESNIVNAYKRIKGKNLKQKYHEGDVIEFSFSGEDVFVFPEPEDFKKELSLG
jgi:ABC-type Fe3+/spermidine/putrescine transport system ATPase subunit